MLEKINKENILISDYNLTSKLYTIISESIKYKQLKVGINNIIKLIALNKIDLIILAGDCDPIELIESTLNLCEEYDIPYIFVPSKACLGRASGITRPTLACALLKQEDNSLVKQIEDIKNKIYEFSLMGQSN